MISVSSDGKGIGELPSDPGCSFISAPELFVLSYLLPQMYYRLSIGRAATCYFFYIGYHLAAIIRYCAQIPVWYVSGDIVRA